MANDYNLTKKKNGTYEKTAYDENGKRVYFYSKDPDEVMQKYYAFINKQDNGYTFKEVADKYKESTFDNIRLGTLRSYIPAWNNAVDYFGDTYIKEITASDVHTYIKKLENTYAYKTVANKKSVLSQIFDYAILELHVEMFNPCTRLKVSKGLSRKKRNALTIEQRKEIDSTQSDEFILAYLIIHTGARLGEALALQVKDINFNTKRVYITKQVLFEHNQPYVTELLKTTKSNREVPLLEPLEIMLNKIIKLYNLKNDDYIACNSNNLITLSQLRDKWGSYCYKHNMAHIIVKSYGNTKPKRNRKEIKADIDRHTLRHEYATVLFEAGIDAKTAQELLGHAQLSTTYDIYTHLRNKQIDNTREILNKHIAGGLVAD